MRGHTEMQTLLTVTQSERYVMFPIEVLRAETGSEFGSGRVKSLYCILR